MVIIIRSSSSRIMFFFLLKTCSIAFDHFYNKHGNYTSSFRQDFFLYDGTNDIGINPKQDINEAFTPVLFFNGIKMGNNGE